MTRRNSNKADARATVRRDGRVYLASLHVGRVFLSAETGCWRGEFAAGGAVASKADAKVVDFARRCDVVGRMVEAVGG